MMLLYDLLDALVRGDRRWCLRIHHQLSAWRRTARVLAVVSRLGDGLFWYALMLALAVQDTPHGAHTALLMLATGIVTLALYKGVKHLVARPRPCERYDTVRITVAPLDRWSFPSGHTMHAVSFTLVAVETYPSLLWLLAPFVGLIMASRVVLGLHYPSDVVAGAFCGLLAGRACLEVASSGVIV